MARNLTLPQIRVDADEKALIEGNARAAGYSGVGPFLRDLGLAPLARKITSPGPDNGLPDPPPGPGETSTDPRVEAEVTEAALLDDPARDAFIERRARELYGAGKTSRVARALAEAEWRDRG